jgi:2-dehydro-3-deoxygluconokinase
MKVPRIVVIGECMAEISGTAESGWRLGYGGDTLNTSVYLARLLGERAQVHYMTRLGGDLFGAQMLQAWAGEGILLDMTEVVADRVTGLYAISTDAAGERSFTYWRDRSPARDLLCKPLGEAGREAIVSADLLYFSGISLAILSDAGRSQLIDLAEEARARGGLVAFDPNHRPRLWPGTAVAKEWVLRAMRASGLILASADDLGVLFGLTERAAQMRLLIEMAPEVLLRHGADPVQIRHRGETGKVRVPAGREVVDTTGAGDSFNAGYLAARLLGLDPAPAARQAARLAAEVIRHPGAIIPLASMPAMELQEA